MRRRAPLFLIAVILVAWGASLTAPFHFDDHLLVADRAVSSPSGWLDVWKPLQTRPLSQFTFWISYALGGSETPLGWHLWNLALHLAATLLVWRCLAVALAEERMALIAAAVFAIHPAQAEAVNYIFARSSQLSTVLCLVAFWYWLKPDRAWAAVIAFGAALLAKEECVTFPFFLAALDWRQGRRPARMPQIGTMLALAGLVGVRALIATRLTPASGSGFTSVISPMQYFASQGTVILRYWRLLVIPWGFTVDTELHTAAPAGLTWLAVALVLALAIRYFPRAGWWLILGFILILPSSSIFPADDLAADRRLYLPMIAWSAVFGIAAARLNWQLLIAGAAVLMGLSIERTMVWHSERSLWREAVERSPDKARPRIQLARAFADDPAAALGILGSAQRRFPDHSDIATEQGRILLETGHAAEALAAFGRALALKPNDPAALNNRGAALAALGQLDAARGDFEKALRLDPCQTDASRNLGRIGFPVPVHDCR